MSLTVCIPCVCTAPPYPDHHHFYVIYFSGRALFSTHFSCFGFSSFSTVFFTFFPSKYSFCMAFFSVCFSCGFCLFQSFYWLHTKVTNISVSLFVRRSLWLSCIRSVFRIVSIEILMMVILHPFLSLRAPLFFHRIAMWLLVQSIVSLCVVLHRIDSTMVWLCVGDEQYVERNFRATK